MRHDIHRGAIAFVLAMVMASSIGCTAITLPLGTESICELRVGEQRLQYNKRKSLDVSLSLHESGPRAVSEFVFEGRYGRAQISPGLASELMCRYSRFMGDTIYLYPVGASVRNSSGMVVSTDAGRYFVESPFPGREAPPVMVDGAHVLNYSWGVEALEFVSASELVLIQSSTLCAGCADALVRRAESRDAGKSWVVTDYAILEPQAIPAVTRIIEHTVELHHRDNNKAEVDVVRENKAGTHALQQPADEFWKHAPKSAHEINRSIPGGGTIKSITDEPWINEAGKVVGIRVKALIHFGDEADLHLGVHAQQQSGSQQLTPMRLYDCMVRQPDGVTLHRELRCRDLRYGLKPSWQAFRRNADYEFTFLLTPKNCFTRLYVDEGGGFTLPDPFVPANYGPDIAARYRLHLQFFSRNDLNYPWETKDFTLGQHYRPREFFESAETDPNIKCIR